MKWKSKKLKDMTETELKNQKKIATINGLIPILLLMGLIIYSLIARITSETNLAMMLGITGICFSLVAFYAIEIVAVSFELRIRELKP